MREKSVILLFAVALLVLSGGIAQAALESSPTPSQFNTTQEDLKINWTTGTTGSDFEDNVTIFLDDGSSLASIKAQIENTSSGGQANTISTNYSQPTTGWTLTGDFPSGCTDGNIELKVRNGSDFLTPNTSTIQTTASGDDMTVVLDGCGGNVAVDDRPPGRYFGQLNVTNATNETHRVTLDVTVDIPINTSNTFQDSGNNKGVGEFRGSLDTNETHAHEYFFNTSLLENATSIKVNVTWDTKANDVDLFLFDESDQFLTGSVSRGDSEELVRMHPDEAKMYAFKLYGNNSSSSISYDNTGFLVLGTLNATRSSDTNQIVHNDDFGDMAPGNVNTTNVTIQNEGAVNYTDVTESFEEFYLTQRFSRSSPTGERNFSVRVPDFVTKLDVRVNWTGSTNYTLRLIKPDGTVAGTSADKSDIANITGADAEEFVIHNPPGEIGLGDDGLWTVQVKNNTAGPDAYNVTAKLSLPASDWLSSNYTTRDFNETGLTGDSAVHQFNLTTQNLTLSGELNGKLRYTTARGAITDIDFEANITTGEVMVNDTFNKSTVTVTDNIGFNRSGSGTHTMNMTVNNTGNQDLTFGDDNRANSTGLNLTTDSSKFVDFVVEDEPTGNVVPDGSNPFNISITVDTSETDNNQGIYEGWVFLNDTDANPYQGFNLTVQVNLTNRIDPELLTFQTNDTDQEIENPADEHNVTLDAEVFYKNGTELKASGTDNCLLCNATGNFTVHIEEGNTSKRFPNSGSFTLTNATDNTANGIFFNDIYQINATVPADSSRPGGYYRVHVGATDIRNDVLLWGNRTNTSAGLLRVNNTGLHLQAVTSTSITVDDDKTTTFNLTVDNLGPVNAGGSLQMTDPSKVTVTANQSGDSNCFDSKSSNKFTFTGSDNAKTVNAEGTETCWFEYKIDPDNVSSKKTKTLTVQAADGDSDYGDISVSLTINDADASSGDSGNGDGGGGGAGEEDDTTEEEGLDITSHPETVEILQGNDRSVTVSVENTGNETEDNVELTVDGIDSSWYSTSSSSTSIVADETVNYTVDYTIPSDGEIGDHSVTYRAGNDDVEATASGTLTVTPTNETKSQIEKEYSEKLQNVSDTQNEINDLANQGLNITEANATLAEAREKIRQAGDAIAQGDYIRANQLLSEADSLLAQAREQMERARQEGGGIGLIWIVAGIIALAAIGLVVYMLLPPPDSTYSVSGGFKYRPPGEEGVVQRAKKKIKKWIERIKEKINELTGKEEGGRDYDYTRGGETWS